MTRIVVASFLTIVIFNALAFADPRPFTFTYDAYPIGKGAVEYEQSVTFNAHKGSEHAYKQFEIVHELEYGIADDLDLGFYFLRWKYEDSSENNGTQYDGGAVEFIYTILNPAKDHWGLALYAEFAVAENELEFEQKTILQKDIGKWVFAYNLILESEIAGVFDSKKENEVAGTIGHASGMVCGRGAAG